MEREIYDIPDSVLDFSTLNNILKVQGTANGLGYKKAFAKHIKKNPQYRKLIAVDDFISSKGSDSMRNTASDLLEVIKSQIFTTRFIIRARKKIKEYKGVTIAFHHLKLFILLGTVPSSA